MIITKLEGGLGNQMFQYAIASIFAKKFGTEILIDSSFFNEVDKKEGFTPRNFELKIFKNNYVQASHMQISSFNKPSVITKFKKKIGLNYRKIYKEATLSFDNNLLNSKTPIYLNGYFQSYKYFLSYEHLIKKVFSFPVELLGFENQELLLSIQKSNSVSVHIRRGDYVNDKITQSFHGNCNLEYYKAAIELIASKANDIKLFFFSDDCEWVKSQFKHLHYSKIFVDHNNGENSWKDMCLMSNCNNNIIANSSFSWWAAWLNGNKKKIIVTPKKWYVSDDYNSNDLIPIEWIRL